MLSSWKSLCLILIYLLKVRCMEEINQDTKRPFWNIAYMVDAISQMDDFLDDGANSIKFDVSFDSEGRAEHTYHGFPCDFGRNCFKYENIITYLQYLQSITSPSSPEYRPELVLLIIECKVQNLSPEARVRAGEDLATKLLDYYWQRGESEANASILISVPYVEHMDFVNNFRKTLQRENFTNYESKIGESEANATILISDPYVEHMDFVNNFRKTLQRENFTNYESKIGEFHNPMINEGFFEGDIAGIDPNAGMSGVSQDNQKWPGSVIPYEIDESLKQFNDSILRAMDEIMNNSCIRFVQRTTEHAHFIRIFKGEGCSADWGFKNIGQQNVSLGTGCENNHGAIVHELMHAIGFEHEHNRSDRDDYLNIHWENILEDYHYAFRKLQPDQNRLFTAFDFDSIMMYGQYAFSKRMGELKSMEAKDGRDIPDVGRNGLSPTDITKLKMLYGCKK